jgi:hypothetical protein
MTAGFTIIFWRYGGVSSKELLQDEDNFWDIISPHGISLL